MEIHKCQSERIHKVFIRKKSIHITLLQLYSYFVLLYLSEDHLLEHQMVSGQCNKKAIAKASELNWNTLVNSGLGLVVYELKGCLGFFSGGPKITAWFNFDRKILL